VKKIYLLFTISSADASAGEVGVKLEVKNPSPAATVPAAQAAVGTPSPTAPGAQIQEESLKPLSQEALKQPDSVLSQNNQWFLLFLLGFIWLIFIAAMVFLFFRRRKRERKKNVSSGTFF
jgi:ATP-dependent Zn protease